MIPQSDIGQLEEVKTGYKQHYMINETRINSICDDVEALRQSIYKLLNTERYAYGIYSDQYGISVVDLIGQDKEYSASALELEITDALMRDDRIITVGDFNIKYGRDSVSISFVVGSIYGDIQIEREVNNSV